MTPSYKQINLYSFTEAYRNLNSELFRSYSTSYGINLKNSEIEDILKLRRCLVQCGAQISDWNGFFVGFSIPQISKEFDLLRFGLDVVINIEVKSAFDASKIEYQLKKNQYYLSFAKLKTQLFCFVSGQNSLYRLNESGKLVKIEFRYLLDTLRSYICDYSVNVNNLFKPSNYLISPFNSTSEFIGNNYFLTAQQEEFKYKILNSIENNSGSFYAIKGAAGTGKSLLSYDIIYELNKSNFRVLVIHCGILNEGHMSLIENYKWNVIPIKHFGIVKYEEIDVILIDEAQRIRSHQLNKIIDSISNHGISCIFAYDKKQSINKKEVPDSIASLIEEKSGSHCYELSEKIRSNPEVATFISLLFDKGKVSSLNISNSVQVTYFKSVTNAKEHLQLLSQNGWRAINMTTSLIHVYPYDHYQIDDAQNAHQVIGQEFDNIAVIIDEHFVYSSNKLVLKGYNINPYYNPVGMLYQILTRARCCIHLVIANNPEVLERSLAILK